MSLLNGVSFINLGSIVSLLWLILSAKCCIYRKVGPFYRSRQIGSNLRKYLPIFTTLNHLTVIYVLLCSNKKIPLTIQGYLSEQGVRNILPWGCQEHPFTCELTYLSYGHNYRKAFSVDYCSGIET